jgi:hypothetical protein
MICIQSLWGWSWHCYPRIWTTSYTDNMVRCLDSDALWYGQIACRWVTVILTPTGLTNSGWRDINRYFITVWIFHVSLCNIIRLQHYSIGPFLLAVHPMQKERSRSEPGWPAKVLICSRDAYFDVGPVDTNKAPGYLISKLCWNIRRTC